MSGGDVWDVPKELITNANPSHPSGTRQPARRRTCVLVLASYADLRNVVIRKLMRSAK